MFIFLGQYSWIIFFLDSKLVVLVIELLNQFFATIENLQWFSEALLPLNGISEATIDNDGFSMVLGQLTIGNDGFRWLTTIGPTMEW